MSDGPERDAPTTGRRFSAGRVGRTTPLVGLGARTGLGRVGVLLRPGSSENRRQRTLDFHARSAERYAQILGDMKGAVMKAGQILSFVEAAGIVPDEHRELYQRALEVLQADAPPMEPALVGAIVHRELGAPPDEVFDRFSLSPIAAASIGQVHAARLGDRELAVKVQYPGIADAIEADLDNTELLSSLMRFGARAMPGFSTRVDFRSVAEEVRDRVVEELDYTIEAANQQDFAALYRGHPYIRIPEVVPELSTSKVLTMDLVDGRRFKAACESPPELRNRWGEVITRFVFNSLWHHGLFNADPHPGNYLFHEDGSVTFLDFGCVKRFGQETITTLLDIERGVLDDDAVTVRDAFVSLGALDPDDDLDPERILEWYRPTYASVLEEGEFTYTREYAAEVVARHFDPFGEWKDVVSRFDVPRDIVFLNRILVGLYSVLGMLEATADWRRSSAEVRGSVTPTSELGRLHAEWLTTSVSRY